ncbi:GNAT family N-acetyltransferase [Alteribacter keqinensis]|uniref:N-acetyltransferase n=1 Tax=Alteribacter keqinensis TaxID=2483800 RepID=A0A3M7TWZ0_9BACI|nr:GNAT family protein [Alteribacter keqinensis]RNA69294.1 N-acetyltransferase [Alteribacter keqinensis]
MNIPDLKTADFLLTRVKAEDSVDLFSIFKDKETMKFITPHPVTSLEQMEEKMAAIISLMREGKEAAWIIRPTDNNEAAGLFRFHKIHKWHQKAEMNAVLSPVYQNSGVMTQILPRVLSFGFEELKLNRIAGDIFIENQGSRRLLEKNGFHCDGILRQTDFDGERFYDTAVYSILRDEYLWSEI